MRNKTIIYGIKNDMNKIWYEYYFYNMDKYRCSNKSLKNFDIIETIKQLRKEPLLNGLNEINLYILEQFLKDKNLTIFSFEVHNELLNELDLHINMNDTLNLPYYGETYNIKKDIIIKKNNFVVDELKHFIENIDNYCKYFNLINIKEHILSEINKYNYVDYIVFYKKTDNSIAIMWLGLNNNDYIDFLQKYNWGEDLIDCYKNNNMTHIKNEINIIYEIINNKLRIVRTNIYGSI